MKFKCLLFISLSLAACNSSSNKSPASDTTTVLSKPKTDTITYKSIVIGGQEWMADNLNLNTFSNGDTIMEAKTNDDWENAAKSKTPAWCYYDNDPARATKYGRLYNWYAVTDSRGLAPKGWQIPKQEDYQVLIDYLGRDSSGVMLKSKTDWQVGNGVNAVGFNARPAGVRVGGLINGSAKDDSFTLINRTCNYWSSSEYDYVDDGTKLEMYDVSKKAEISGARKGYGLSVRCFKPAKVNVKSDGVKQPTTFKSVKIGNQIWMTENLNVSSFRNGDPITEAPNPEASTQLGSNQKPVYCYYNNSVAFGNQYGKLYNWYAVNDARGLAPKGWHIPTRTEFETLITYLHKADSAILSNYIDRDAIDNLSSILSSKKYWNNAKNTNLTGFNALPSGQLYYFFEKPAFKSLGDAAYFWGTNVDMIIAPEHNGSNVTIPTGDIRPMECKAVRCIKDN